MSATDIRRDLSELAPKFRAAVEAALAECEAKGLDASVFEARRTDERQRWLYEQGRVRPGDVVTNAKSAFYSWHAFGLAVDVISRSMEWSAPETWWQKVATIFVRHGCDWGGDWHQRDLPHFQWGTLKDSPSDRARQLYRDGGLEAVWKEVGAWEEPAPAPSGSAAEAVVPPIPDVEPEVVPPPLYDPEPSLPTVPPVLHTITVPEPPEDARGVSALWWAREAAGEIGAEALRIGKSEAATLLPAALERLRGAYAARAPGWLVSLTWPWVERAATSALERGS